MDKSLRMFIVGLFCVLVMLILGIGFISYTSKAYAEGSERYSSKVYGAYLPDITATDYPHHETHEGHMYVASMVNGLMGAGDIHNVLINTVSDVAGNSAHMTIQATSAGEGGIKLYEAPTLLTNGTLWPNYNRNRNVDGPGHIVTIFNSPSIQTDGTLLDETHFGSGVHAGGGFNQVNEWILKPDTKYIVRMFSDAANNELRLTINWYASEGLR